MRKIMSKNINWLFQGHQFFKTEKEKEAQYFHWQMQNSFWDSFAVLNYDYVWENMITF